MSKRAILGPAGMGGLTALRGASSLIRSIQYGTLTFAGTGSGTAAITAVDPLNAYVQCLGVDSDTTIPNGVYPHGRVALTTSVLVTGTGFADTPVRTLSFMVLEWAPGLIKSLQQGTVTIATGAASGTATILAVDPRKTLLVWGGHFHDSASDLAPGRITLTSATVVTGARTGSPASNDIFGFTAVEYF